MTRSIRISLASAVLASLALAAPTLSVAQTPTPSPAPAATTLATPEASFKRADANADNKLSKEEAARLPAIAAKFDELDKDKDGSLSMDEFMAGNTK